MVGSIIEFGIGYFLWKYVPGMITSCPKKLRLALEITGIVIMVFGVISIINDITNLLHIN